MSTNSLQGNRSNPVAGLGTFTHTVVNPGQWTIDVKSTLPLGSGLEIAIKQNGTNLITPVGGATSNPTPTQPILSAGANTYANAGDTLTVVLSSSNAIDSQPNSVKSIVNLFQGFT